MAKKDIRVLLRKRLGPKAAAAVLKKVRKSIKQGATPARARKVLLDAVKVHLAKEIPPADVLLIDWQPSGR